jgi:hypothetical protein
MVEASRGRPYRLLTPVIGSAVPLGGIPSDAAHPSADLATAWWTRAR